MPIAQAVRRPGAVSNVYVYVDDFGINGMQGRLFFYGGDEMSFSGMLEMLKITESVLDRYSTPQPVFQYREFDGGTKAKTHKEPRDRAMEQKDETVRAEGSEAHESKATFVIHVKYRQNATWQGEIKWVNRDKIQYFRSSLEMIKLMDEALEEELGKSDKTKWK
ncbi:MAG: hypothetical protein P4M02_12265 [Clostridia bacterium]|nr:hypothetical protein [Clostridia bacterium]